MSLAPAIRAAVAVLRTRAADLLPAFFLRPAVSAVGQAVGVLGVGLAYGYLGLIGGLEQFRGALSERDLEPPDPDAEPEAFVEWVDGVSGAFDPLLTPTTALILATTAMVVVLLLVVLNSVATAAQFAACRATLDDARGTTAAIRGARRYWLAMLVLLILEIVLWLVVSTAVLVAVVFAALVSPVAGALVGLVAGLTWAIAVAVIRLVFAFAPAAVVVDDVGVGDAVGHTAGFVRSEPVGAMGYSLLAVALLVAVGSVAALSPEAGSALVGVLSFLVVAPALGLTKTALYARHADSISPPEVPDESAVGQLLAGLRRGLTETAAFVRASPGAHAASTGLFVGGFALGWMLAAPYDGLVATSIEARLEGHVPPTAAVFFGANNWSVAVGSAVSGLALAVPAAVTLAFNGAVFGIYGRLEEAPLELLAFVAPHGILEIPALVVAGALGLSLGATSWRAIRGRVDRRELADATERAFWVLVGLGVVLGVAAVVEAFVSPYYYRPFLSIG